MPALFSLGLVSVKHQSLLDRIHQVQALQSVWLLPLCVVPQMVQPEHTGVCESYALNPFSLFKSFLSNLPFFSCKHFFEKVSFGKDRLWPIPFLAILI